VSSSSDGRWERDTSCSLREFERRGYTQLQTGQTSAVGATSEWSPRALCPVVTQRRGSLRTDRSIVPSGLKSPAHQGEARELLRLQCDFPLRTSVSPLFVNTIKSTPFCWSLDTKPPGWRPRPDRVSRPVQSTNTYFSLLCGKSNRPSGARIARQNARCPVIYPIVTYKAGAGYCEKLRVTLKSRSGCFAVPVLHQELV